MAVFDKTESLFDAVLTTDLQVTRTLESKCCTNIEQIELPAKLLVYFL